MPQKIRNARGNLQIREQDLYNKLLLERHLLTPL